ncbi:MAG: hypothetical protein LBT20_02115 [Clostridiales bacterium]|nr:hypothetical protein [Clostridiales bacterium]
MEQTELTVLSESDSHAATDGVQSGGGKGETGTVSYGKFKNADALFRAYLSLEAEFTKRSQRLREIERRLAFASENGERTAAVAAGGGTPDAIAFSPQTDKSVGARAAGGTAKNITEEARRASNVSNAALPPQTYKPTEDGEVVAERLKSESFLERYVYGDERIKDRIIADYVEGLRSVNLPKLIGKGGETAAAPPKRPKTLKEAGELAEKMLKK